MAKKGVKINIEVMKEELVNLTSLLELCTKEEKEFTVEGIGFVSKYEEQCYHTTKTAQYAIANLVSATIGILKDATDGFIEEDTYDAKQLQQYRKGVLPSE